MKQTIKRPSAQRLQTQADIVFCVDATASMKPCIDGVLSGLHRFAEGIQTAAAVDYRLRLIAYRDLHDPTCTVGWDIFEFSSKLDEFRYHLNKIRAHCNQKHRGAESTLDAIYHAIHSSWRTHKTHKTIVVLTDDNTHPRLHRTTYNRPDNDVNRVIQDFQELRHAMLFMVAPKYPLYSKIEQSMIAAERKVVAVWVPENDERYEGLGAVDWGPLMNMLGEVVSATSIVTTTDL
jgi:hypothetical protein